jgi:hypothetical protein
MAQAAIGVAVHSAWALTIMVAGRVGGDGKALLDRGRIELATGPLPYHPYHAAAESALDLAVTEQLLDEWSEAARHAVIRHVEAAAVAAQASGHRLAVCAIAALPKKLPPLDAILRSHPLLHAAEGQLALGAIADGASDAGLTVSHVNPDALAAVADAVAAIGQVAGRPWAVDQKKAAAAALVALA